jgi:hypothetical protein
MRRYNFQRIRRGVGEMAQGVAVHAPDLEAAVTQAHALNQTPPGETLRFIGNDPCAGPCPMCDAEPAHD